MKWRCRDHTFSINKPLLAGILNVTPDSFSDGGAFLSQGKAVERALVMQAEGAEIIDIGGESTRPGAPAVCAEQEQQRVLPVIRDIMKRNPASVISIDTTKQSVAQAAIEAGACIINDISGMEADPAMLEYAVASQAGVILMHKQGTPATMQQAPSYENVVAEVYAYLQSRIHAWVTAGGNRLHVAIDPGFGFGKTLEHNLLLLRNLSTFSTLSCPVMAAFSRKSMFGQITDQDVDQRLAASLAGLCYAVMQGCHLLRVHDVKESCDAIQVLATLQSISEVVNVS